MIVQLKGIRKGLMYRKRNIRWWKSSWLSRLWLSCRNRSHRLSPKLRLKRALHLRLSFKKSRINLLYLLLHLMKTVIFSASLQDPITNLVISSSWWKTQLVTTLIINNPLSIILLNRIIPNQIFSWFKNSATTRPRKNLPNDNSSRSPFKYNKPKAPSSTHWINHRAISSLLRFTKRR